MSQSDFFKAVQAGQLQEVLRLLEADPALLNARNERGATAVLVACYTGQKEVRDALIGKGATLELHEAAATGRLSRVRKLVEADPAAAKGYSPDGFPVLALAAVFGHEETARYLLASGADVNAVATNGSGYTALTGAVTNGHAAIAAWLVANGADVNYRYSKNYSPLLAAAANGHLDILKMLIAHGAESDARTDDGKTALGLAEERKHQAVAEYLRGLGPAPRAAASS